MGRLLARVLPAQADNRFGGHPLALWLLGAYVALKLVMSLNSIVNTATIASGADGFRLELYGSDGARAVLLLFAIVGLGQLALAVSALIVLARYRALVPLAFLLLAGEHLARRALVQAYAVERSQSAAAASYINTGLLVLLLAGLVLSLWGGSRAPGRREPFRS